MDVQHLQVLAGVTSSLIFVLSNFPMLLKAFRTKDLRSYSFGHIALSNFGNLVHWVYVSSLPFGPIWFLHGFFTLSTAAMLVCYLHFRRVTAL